MAAGVATVTALTNILKTKYDQRKLNVMAYEEDPLLALMKKKADTNFGGNNARVTLRYGSPQGGSNNFTQALNNKSTSLDAGFLLTRAKDYHISGIDGETLEAGEGNENTILDAVKGEMDGSMRMIRRSLEIGVYGNGGGARGRISSTSDVATTTITLSDPNQIVNFEKGMTIQTGSADGTSGALRNSGATLTISALDRDAGTITASAAWDTVTGTVANDYIFRAGDFGTHIKGLSAWLPLAAPTSGDSFFGVDRSVDTTRLAGIRYTASAGSSKEQTLIKATARLAREMAKPDMALVNVSDLSDIALSLGTRIKYEPKSSSDGVFGFQAIQIVTPTLKQPLSLMGTINVPTGEFYILQSDTWVLKSAGGAPHIDMGDGLRMARDASSDSYTWRLRYYAQLGCEAPGWNLHGTF